MLIAFAFSFIGVLLVFGNYKLLRHRKALAMAFILTIPLALAGIYLVDHSDMKNPFFLMAMVSPLVALILLEIARLVFYRVRRQEIILYLGGFVPKRFEERFVSRLEKVVTFLLTLMALGIPYLIIRVLG